MSVTERGTNRRFLGEECCNSRHKATQLTRTQIWGNASGTRRLISWPLDWNSCVCIPGYRVPGEGTTSPDTGGLQVCLHNRVGAGLSVSRAHPSGCHVETNPFRQRPLEFFLTGLPKPSVSRVSESWVRKLDQTFNFSRAMPIAAAALLASPGAECLCEILCFRCLDKSGPRIRGCKVCCCSSSDPITGVGSFLDPGRGHLLPRYPGTGTLVPAGHPGGNSLPNLPC